MKRLVLFALLTHPAYGLSLVDAETRVFNGDRKLRGFSESQSGLDAKMTGVNVSLLPTLNLEYAKGKTIDPKSNTGSTTWTARMDLTNPLQFMASRDGVTVEKKARDVEEETYRHSVLFKVRTAYFQTKLLELQLAQAERNLKTAEKVEAVSNQQFALGIKHSIDKDRSKLEADTRRLETRKAASDLASQKEVLRMTLRLEKDEPLVLDTALPERFHPVGTKIEIARTGNAKRLAVDVERTENLLAQENASLLPTLSLNYTQRKDEGDPTIRNKSYGASLTWNVGAGRYYGREAATANLSSNRNLLEHATYTDALDVTKTATDLATLLEQLDSQRAIVSQRARISEDSRKKYEQGIIALNEYYDDVRVLLVEENSLLTNRFQAVQLLATLAQVLEDEKLFYQGMGL